MCKYSRVCKLPNKTRNINCSIAAGECKLKFRAFDCFKKRIKWEYENTQQVRERWREESGRYLWTARVIWNHFKRLCLVGRRRHFVYFLLSYTHIGTPTHEHTHKFMHTNKMRINWFICGGTHTRTGTTHERDRGHSRVVLVASNREHSLGTH